MNSNEHNLEVHETAFMTCAFRAMDENLSQDPYAKLWYNDATQKWIDLYMTEVSSEELPAHCLRNRFFLESIKKTVQENNIEVLINFGSGFSMYPFLLDKNLTHIEIDKPEVINLKKKKIENFIADGFLPKRTIHYVGVDFATDYQAKLTTLIDSIKANKSTFILIEGVVFFLNRAQTDHLFEFFSSIQQSGDFIGSASFRHELKDTLAFQKLIQFMNRRMVPASASDFQTVADAYYANKPLYTLTDHQDYFSLSKTYQNTVRLQKEEILNEHFYILQKQ